MGFFRSLCCLSLIALLTVPALQAQAIEDDGPFAIGWSDATFTDQNFNEGSVSVRIYYPALAAGEDATPDPSGGPFPLIGMQHGWLGNPTSYDDLSTHIASWGFVVLSTDTESSLFPDQQQFAEDTRAILYWFEDESADAGSDFFGMADGGDWGATGHSMGGGVLARLVGEEPRVTTIVGMQSALPFLPFDPEPLRDMQDYLGNAYQIAGSVDNVVPADDVHLYFERAENARRNVYFEVEGMGHSGCTDTPPNNEPLPGAEQHRMHRRIVTGLFRAELKGEEDLFADILGEGIAVEPVSFESDTAVPPLWVRRSTVDPTMFAVGIAGRPGNDAILVTSPNPDSIDTPFGTLGLDRFSLSFLSNTPFDATGVSEVRVPESIFMGDPDYVQGLSRMGQTGALSRVDAVTATEAGRPTVAGRFDATAYPNPFNPTTTIAYQLTAPMAVQVAVYDVLGRRVALLVDAYQQAGPHEARFDASALPSGTYLYRISSGTFQHTGRMLLAK